MLSPLPDVVLGLLVALGLLLAAGAAAAQMALGAANRVRLRDLAEPSSSRSEAVSRLLDERLFVPVGLPVLQAVGLLIATGSAVALTGASLSLAGVPSAVVLMTFIGLVLLVCLLLPMVWASRDPESVVLVLAVPLTWLTPVLAPVLAAFRFLGRVAGAELPEVGRLISEEELRALVNIDDENGPIEEDEMEMIAGIMELGETKVREVMVPRIDVVAISIDATLDEALDTIIGAGHSRIPVYRETIDDLAGLLYAKDLLRPFRSRDYSPKLGDLLRDAHYVPESKPVDELLRELRHRQVHMAIVVDEYGGTAGLVTIEDLLEEIVGEIQDEYDAEEPRIEFVNADEVLLDAGVDIDDVNRLLDIDLPTDEVDTMAGLVFTSLGKVPEVGEKASFDEAEIEVVAVSGRRIRRVRVVRLPVESVEPAPSAAEAGG